jgi:hypothetical protein
MGEFYRIWPPKDSASPKTQGVQSVVSAIEPGRTFTTQTIRFNGLLPNSDRISGILDQMQGCVRRTGSKVDQSIQFERTRDPRIHGTQICADCPAAASATAVCIIYERALLKEAR